MRIKVRLHGFEPSRREVDLAEGATVMDLLRALDIRRDLVLVFRKERPVPDTASLADGDEVRVLRVVSGG